MLDLLDLHHSAFNYSRLRDVDEAQNWDSLLVSCLKLVDGKDTLAKRILGR